MSILLDIVIVNWNSGKQLLDCLESIISADRDDFELSRVVVVDNASSDASANGLEYLDLPLTIIINSENRGFGAACNQGAVGSKADYLLFLNPDTRLFTNSLVKPIHFMQQIDNKDIGICGIQLVNQNNQISRSCAYFPSLSWYFIKSFGLNILLPRFCNKLLPQHFMLDWEHNDSRKVDQVIGAFFLVRRDLFEILNGFDERFFVYFEEVDFSLRAYQAGFFSFYFSDVQAFHKGGGTSEKVKAYRLFYILRSRIKYGYKHFNRFEANILGAITLTFEPISRIIFALYKLSFEEINEIAFGYCLLLKYYLLGFKSFLIKD